MSETEQVELPERVTLWLCCHCKTPRTVGLSVCERCHKRLYDKVEYVHASVLVPQGDAADVLKVLVGRHHAEHHRQFDAASCPAWPCDILRAAIPVTAPMSTGEPLNPLENDPPVVVHLGNMPIAEEEAYTRAELKRRFEISERLRNATTPVKDSASEAKAKEIVEEYKQRVIQLPPGDAVPCAKWLEMRLRIAFDLMTAEIERLQGWQEGLTATAVAWSEQRLSEQAAVTSTTPDGERDCKRQGWPCRYRDARQCARDTMLGAECPKVCECECHAATPPPAVTTHPFGPCGYQNCDWPDGELRCNETRTDVTEAGEQEQRLLTAEELADIERFQRQRRKNPVAVDAWLYVAEIDRLLTHVRLNGTRQDDLFSLRQQVEDTIAVAQTENDAEGFITAYHFKTGAIHRLLAEARK